MGRMWALLVAVLLTTSSLQVFSVQAHAEEPIPAGDVVERVVVRGTKWIEDAAVRAKIRIREGDVLTEEAARRDLKAVYGTGFFDNVVIKAEPGQNPGQSILVFEVSEKPAVVNVRLEGNKKVSEEDLRELIDVKSFGILNEAKVTETIGLMRDKYVEKGFYLADITSEIVPFGTDQVEVVFRFEENRKVIIQRIDFTGNDSIADGRIKRFMQSKEGGPAPWLTSTGSFDAEKLATDAQIIQYLYMEEGYVDVRVDQPKVYLSPDKRYIYISFHVEEGPQYTIGSVDIQGDFVEEEGLTRDDLLRIAGGTPVLAIQEEQYRRAKGANDPRAGLRGIGKGPALEEGEVFKYSTMGAVIENLANLYEDQGYAFANVVPSPRPNRDNQTIDITFNIDKGDKYRIGRIHIIGNDPTFDKVVRREILVSEGDIFRGSRLDASRFRLQRLGFFEEVNITTPRGVEPGTLDVHVKVVEQPTGSFSFGLGWSSLEGFTIQGSISKNNFMGMGYTLSAQGNLSRFRKQASLEFFDPYFLDSRWTFRISAYYIDQQYQFNVLNNNQNEYRRGGTLSIGRYLDRRDDIQLQMSYTIADVGVANLDPYREKLLGGELFRNGITSTVGVNLFVDKRNNRIAPTKGVLVSASAALSGGFNIDEDKTLSLLGGDFNFVETKFNFRLYQPILPNSDFLVFRMNTTLGSVWSTDGRPVPVIHRYRAGGMLSVRGFQWFSLGPSLRVTGSDDPTDPEGRLVIGGTQTWINNFEIEANIVKAAGITAVAFFDAGNAFGDAWGEGNISLTGLRTSAGFGVRWRSPVGPLRFEWGFPLAPRKDEKRSDFQFTIGSFF